MGAAYLVLLIASFLLTASAATPVDIDGPLDQWRGVKPAFRDHVGDTAARDFDGAAGLHYTNRSGRNDLVALKVARDDRNVYWYARTCQPITPHTDRNWMWLLVESDGNTGNGWQGYDFVVNRSVEGDQTTWLERCLGGWHWEKVARVRYRVEGDQLHLAVPRAALRLAHDQTALSLGFKWIDNAQKPGDIMDVYQSGDAAPEGRFMYRYLAE